MVCTFPASRRSSSRPHSRRRNAVSELVLRLPTQFGEPAEREALLMREWLVTNGLGGYASGTVGGVTTRRYHGILVAALPARLGRRVMLNHLSEQLRLRDGTIAQFGGEETVGASLELHGADYLREFRLEHGL